jgi:cyclopropane fatty-acyl-phospholipid synthase-like methyltransferase
MIDGMTQSLEAQRRRGINLAITPMLGDICTLDLEPASFDGIYSLEAIEHVHSLEQMFDKCVTLLRAGGRMVLVNDSNRYDINLCRSCSDQQPRKGSPGMRPQQSPNYTLSAQHHCALVLQLLAPEAPP